MPLFVDRLTSSGRGAVAVLRIVADESSRQRLDQYFRSASGRKASAASPNVILYGHWGAEDVVLVRISEKYWELQCHGGEAAVARILADLQNEPPLEQPQLTLQQRLVQKSLQCRTLRTLRYLLSQQHGVLSNFLQTLLECRKAEDALPPAELFLGWQRFAQHLTRPWNVAVVGQPNAGKSSLVNAVAGFERSIVYDQPGTTRDLVEVEAVIDGFPFRLTDTAGVRSSTSDQIEAQGMHAARRSMTTSDVCLLVADSTLGWSDEDETILQQIPQQTPVAIVWNKIDRPSSLSAIPDRHVVFHTAITTRQGLDPILLWLSNVVMEAVPNLHEPLPVIPSLAEHIRDFVDTRNLSRLHEQLRNE